jgi:hypothetical protein
MTKQFTIADLKDPDSPVHEWIRKEYHQLEEKERKEKEHVETARLSTTPVLEIDKGDLLALHLEIPGLPTDNEVIEFLESRCPPNTRVIVRPSPVPGLLHERMDALWATSGLPCPW